MPKYRTKVRKKIDKSKMVIPKDSTQVSKGNALSGQDRTRQLRAIKKQREDIWKELNK